MSTQAEPRLIVLKYSDWADQFRPIPCLDEDPRGDYYKFETFGPQYEQVMAVLAVCPGCVWTWMDGDGCGDFIGDGWHWVNRLGYFLTEVPAADGCQYVIDY